MAAARHKVCVRCGTEFVPGSGIARYCGPACRPGHRGPQPKVSASKRGYDGRHQSARKRALALLRDGDPCARCGGPMFRDEPLDYDHADDRRSYLGLSHASCNRQAGARNRARLRSGAVSSQEW